MVIREMITEDEIYYDDEYNTLAVLLEKKSNDSNYREDYQRKKQQILDGQKALEWLNSNTIIDIQKMQMENQKLKIQVTGLLREKLILESENEELVRVQQENQKLKQLKQRVEDRLKELKKLELPYEPMNGDLYTSQIDLLESILNH